MRTVVRSAALIAFSVACGYAKLVLFPYLFFVEIFSVAVFLSGTIVGVAWGVCVIGTCAGRGLPRSSVFGAVLDGRDLGASHGFGGKNYASKRGKTVAARRTIGRALLSKRLSCQLLTRLRTASTRPTRERV